MMNHFAATFALGAALSFATLSAAQTPPAGQQPEGHSAVGQSSAAQGSTAHEQGSASQKMDSKMDSKMSSDKSAVSVTGCLAKGDEANEYSIRDSGGKTYGLMSSKVNLKPHVGHQVSVTGTPMKEKSGSEKHETKAEESEHLRVTDLKMISTSCQ